MMAELPAGRFKQQRTRHQSACSHRLQDVGTKTGKLGHVVISLISQSCRHWTRVNQQCVTLYVTNCWCLSLN